MKRSCLVLILVLLTCLSSAQPTPEELSKHWVGRKFSNLSLRLTTGEKVTNSTLRGKVVVLDFWATWCGPCRALSQVLDVLYNAYKKQGLSVYGVNLYERKDGAAEQYLLFRGPHYPVSLRNDKFGRATGVSILPAFFVLDKKGTVRYVQVGINANTPHSLEVLIRKLLAEKG